MSAFHLSTSRTCRQRCAFCDADLTGHPLPPAELRRRIDAAIDGGATRIRFTGDDPLLHPHLLRALNHAVGRGVKVELHTHGGGLDDPQRLQRLHKLGLHRLHVSLHGDASTHDALTATPGSHSRVHRVIAQCRGIALTLHSTLTATNLHSLEQLAADIPPHVERWVLHRLRPSDGSTHLTPQEDRLLHTVGRILTTSSVPVRVRGHFGTPFTVHAHHEPPTAEDLALLAHDLPPVRPVRLTQQQLSDLASRRGATVERLGLRWESLGLPVRAASSLPALTGPVYIRCPADPLTTAAVRALADALRAGGLHVTMATLPGTVQVRWGDDEHDATWDLWSDQPLPAPRSTDHLWLSDPGRTTEAVALGWSPEHIRLVPIAPLPPGAHNPLRRGRWLTVGWSGEDPPVPSTPANGEPGRSTRSPAGVLIGPGASPSALRKWAAWAAGRGVPWVLQAASPPEALLRSLGGHHWPPGSPWPGPSASAPAINWADLGESLTSKSHDHGSSSYIPHPSPEAP